MLSYTALRYTVRDSLIIKQPGMVLSFSTEGSNLWIPFVDPLCGSLLWIPFVDPFCGSLLWIPFVDPLCGSLLWSMPRLELLLRPPHNTIIVSW